MVLAAHVSVAAEDHKALKADKEERKKDMDALKKTNQPLARLLK